MKKIQLFLAAIVAVMMTSCLNFKTEATVDVEVTKAGQPVEGIEVYKFKDNGLGEGTTIYKSNATTFVKTNAAGIAHFDLKSPDDLDPSNVAGLEVNDEATFFFCTYAKQCVQMLSFGRPMASQTSSTVLNLRVSTPTCWRITSTMRSYSGVPALW